MNPWAELLRAGVGHAVSGALLGLLVAMIVVVVGWSTATDPASSWRGAARVAGAVWVLAHLGDISLGLAPDNGGDGLVPVTLAPLGAVALVMAVHVRAGRRLAVMAHTWQAPASALPTAVGAAALTSALAGGLVAMWATGPAVAVPVVVAAAHVGGVALVGAGIGAVSAVLAAPIPLRQREHPSRARRAARLTRRWLRLGVAALSTWFVAGSLLVSVSLAVHVAASVDMHEQLGAGAVGGAFLLLGQALYLPDLAVWAGALLAGPGFTIGPAALTPSGSGVSDLPAVPALLALGPPGAYPMWAWAGALTVVAAGAVAGRLGHRSAEAVVQGVADRVSDGVATGVIAGAGAAGLAWAASGSIAAWGPVSVDPLLLGLAVAAEAGAGAVAAGVALHLLDGRALVTMGWMGRATTVTPRPAAAAGAGPPRRSPSRSG